MHLRLRVNGAVQELEANPNRTVLSLLREDLRLTGTKHGCSVGVCGLCSVLLDGQLSSACLLLAPMVDGRALTTIEGIGPPNGLNGLQQAFIDHAGFQCGICHPVRALAETGATCRCWPSTRGGWSARKSPRSPPLRSSPPNGPCS